MNLADYKIAAAIGVVGIAIVLGHVVGPDVVPPFVAALGAAVGGVAALFVALTERRRADWPEDSEGER
jgi:hypothetical protein